MRRSLGSGTSEILIAPHQWANGLREPDAAVRGLVVFQQRHEDPRTCQRGVVERVGEADLAVAVAVAEVGAAGLPVVKRRAAVSLAILAKARHPAFDVVHPI